MTFVAIVAGMFLGGVFFNGRSGLAGVLLGGCFGYTLHALSQLRSKLDSLQRDLELMRLQQRRPAPEREAPQTEQAPEIVVPDPPIPPWTGPKVSEPPRAPAGNTAYSQQKTYYQPPEPPRQPEPPRSPRPSEPSTEAVLPEWLERLISGENLLVKLGVVILFFGVSFLVKYAAQHGMFPLELRLVAAALGGFVLLAIGWRLRERRPVYAQVVQGGGAGILYLTTFAAMRLYHFIPTVAGFCILAAICILTALLAVLQEAPPMAFLATAGGFLAPELAGIGSGNPVVLFSYYALLNAGIIAIAWFRAWRELNLLGFVFTFVVSALWGARFYHPDYFATVEPFLALFFVTYTAVPLLFARRGEGDEHGFLDGTLVFGTPIIGFVLQAALVQHYEYGLAWSALAVSIFYLSITALLGWAGDDEFLPFCDAFLAFGIVFATLAIPLGFDGRWTAAAWSVEGAALVWIALRQERRLARAFGYLLLIGSGLSFIGEISRPAGTWPVLNSFYCGCVLISGSAVLSAWLLHRHAKKLDSWEAPLEALLFVWGIVWWYASGLHEIHLHTLAGYLNGAYLAFIALSCGAAALLRPRLLWPLLNVPALGLLPAMYVFAIYLFCSASHPATKGAALAWPIAFAIWYGVLKGEDDRNHAVPAVAHAAAVWLLTLLLAWEGHWQIGHRDPQLATWAAIMWGVVPAAIILLTSLLGKRLPWPVSRHYDAYLGLGAAPLALLTWIWAVGANVTMPGNPWPLRYLPILNPLDAATLLVLAALAAWYLEVEDALPDLDFQLPHRELRAAYGATIFLWLNASLLRTIHHWSGVPFTADALFRSVLVQGALSVLWGLTALVMMTVAARRSLRPVWFGGAALLVTVVAKLFLVDLANRGSIERIVSFVAVGILLLIIGWFAPVPPRDRP